MIKSRRQILCLSQTVRERISGRRRKMRNMKRSVVITLTLLVFASLAWAEDSRPPEPTQNPEAPYRLFATQNIYMFLKLDTRTGRIWQVQWGDKDHRFTDPLNL